MVILSNERTIIPLRNIFQVRQYEVQNPLTMIRDFVVLNFFFLLLLAKRNTTYQFVK